METTEVGRTGGVVGRLDQIHVVDPERVGQRQPRSGSRAAVVAVTGERHRQHLPLVDDGVPRAGEGPLHAGGAWWWEDMAHLEQPEVLLATRRR